MTTIQIDDSTSKGKALLAYLRTLDFVTVANDDFVLTEDHVTILDERREKHLSGDSKSYSWDTVKSSLNKNKTA